ncbi:MAG: hypoxanthine phosphoribosyltransferase [Caldisericia bacterium]|nr:hypoxanthine phosphoribosyltransferase [Caldisericia bacterium]MDD4614747.1 hypoxanthine phosphoribosyltransferase [Caldisericia bacterium]
MSWNIHPSDILLNEDQIQSGVERVALEISNTFPTNEPLLMIGVLNGAFIFLSDLCRRIQRDIAVDFIQISSYGQNLCSSGNITIKKDISLSVFGRSIILVEDIIDSGHSMVFLQQYFALKGAKKIYVCTFLDKKDRREVPLNIDFCGFTIPNHFVVGYGLDAKEQHRCLPYVAIINEEKE